MRGKKCTVIMLTLRGLNSVEWVNQFLLYNRGLTLATGEQMRHVIFTYITCNSLREYSQMASPKTVYEENQTFCIKCQKLT